MSEYDIQIVTATDVLALRTALLQRHQASSPSVPGDEYPDACHVAALYDQQRVGIGSIHPEPMPNGYRTDSWRLHGIAVEHGHRGVGIGALLVDRCLEHAALHDAKAVWCVAPAGAYGFFEGYGLRRTGDPIDDHRGPQYILVTELGPLRRSWKT